MFSIRIAFCLMLLLVGSAAHAIVNGTEVSDQRFAANYPWAVTVVKNSDGDVCGGVLVAPRWVLTAAHCSWGRRHIRAGNARRSEAQRFDVADTYRHPDFSLDTLQNDIALLYLEEAVDADPVTLASPVQARMLLREGVTGRIMGWGRTEESKQPVDRLREAVIRLDDYTRVGTRYAYRYKTAPCGRDSGSPMLLQTLDGRWLLVGIANATSGNLCAMGGGMAIYTSIAPVSEFILDRLQAAETR